MIDWDKPDFVNVEGVKWWYDESLTQYINIKGMVGWVVEETNGRHNYVITENNMVIAENPTLDGIGCKIDIIKLSRKENLND